MIETLLRDLAPQVLGALMRRYRDFPAAEDAVQEALLAAAQQWPEAGIPDNPRGWLIRAASRRLTDEIRSHAARRRREDVIVMESDTTTELDAEGLVESDDTLVLLFMCCHASLTAPSAIALTLRAVGGLTTAEIAAAFLVPEATMAQRISRAKATVKASGVAFALPAKEEWGERLRAVLHVLYLVFNEGYTAQRVDLAREGIRLARAMHALRPDDGEIAGLLALMLLTDARRDARTGDEGELIALDEQDRSRWDHAAIALGTALVHGAMQKGAIGPYQLQAAIAALHDEARSVDETDWPQILALYTLLARMGDNPVVTLNRAVAVAMVHGPRAGLAELDAIDRDGRLAGSHRTVAIRAHLLERAGDAAGAVVAYRRAATMTENATEQRYLLARAARLAIDSV
ncbi:MAG TPA: sigma-70 family RNA polymerase sigma factor [Kofleriaceae bacterium]|nr:sigma-70 family RNA polymerase sigma factor [Kofleriaceae bacterium]